MKTRFDSEHTWITVNAEEIDVVDMTTAHLMNTYAMLVNFPNRTLAMIVSDLEDERYVDCIWRPFNRVQNDQKKSIQNATSMTAEELVEYATQSPLGLAIKHELEERGVNVEAMLALRNTTIRENKEA